MYIKDKLYVACLFAHSKDKWDLDMRHYYYLVQYISDLVFIVIKEGNTVFEQKRSYFPGLKFNEDQILFEYTGIEQPYNILELYPEYFV